MDSASAQPSLADLRKIVEAPKSKEPWPLALLRERVEALRLTKSEIAAKAGFTRLTVQRVLAGANCRVMTWMAIQGVVEDARREVIRSALARHG